MRETDEFKIAPLAGAKPKPHNVVLEERKKASLTGILDVESFNEKEILVRSETGMLTLFGDGLHNNKLDLDHGQLIVDGFVAGIEYHDEPSKERSVFARLFR